MIFGEYWDGITEGRMKISIQVSVGEVDDEKVFLYPVGEGDFDAKDEPQWTIHLDPTNSKALGQALRGAAMIKKNTL